MKTFKYLLEVEIAIDEKNINEKYPNYKWNFDSIEQFADSLVLEESYEGDTDMSKDGLVRWGYSITKKRTKIL
ncbi:hypothetical protein [Aliarcobacter butzleri]|uniref:hypothetical protein n=1 Tax=Aliarcobacter butzleri TaxID=28197 RepID=UPI00263EA891|nr:hypothetical protein [Aliarcobacter butzleri]MDN5072247.1 hypothetical protein [Aliarcobacter butzleri]MDN5120862.1 hypothetical protein [Aliarcobacter butzleri]MDN5129006.1 hypothetical protein [Aliarcobacter butzleri]